MILLMHLFQVGVSDVGVDLGGADVGVTKERLHRT